MSSDANLLKDQEVQQAHHHKVHKVVVWEGLEVECHLVAC